MDLLKKEPLAKTQIRLVDKCSIVKCVIYSFIQGDPNHSDSELKKMICNTDSNDGNV